MEQQEDRLIELVELYTSQVVASLEELEQENDGFEILAFLDRAKTWQRDFDDCVSRWRASVTHV